MIGTIKNRFDQEGFQMLQKLEVVLFSGDSCNLSQIVQFYTSDFRSVDALGTQLTLLRSAMKDKDINLKSICTLLTISIFRTARILCRSNQTSEVNSCYASNQYNKREKFQCITAIVQKLSKGLTGVWCYMSTKTELTN